MICPSFILSLGALAHGLTLEALKEFFFSLFGMPLFGYVICGPLSFIFGIPFLMLSEKYNKRSFWHYLVGGAAVGALITFKVAISSDAFFASFLFSLFMIFLPAVSVSLTAWAIMYVKWSAKKRSVL